MSENKLHIEVAGNVLDVEGDANLVKAVYEDFKQQIASAEPVAGSQAAAEPVFADLPVSTPAPAHIAAESFAVDPVHSHPVRSDVAPIIQIAENLELEDS